MIRSLAALGAGVIFGVGLCVSQMVNPAKVVAFLDLAGNWDPSLAFVMGGAVLVFSIGFRLALRQPRPVLEEVFQLPTARNPDFSLLAGAALFGVGWGLSGFCPGPALASLGYGLPQSAAFVAAMVAGMAVAAHQPGASRRTVTPDPAVPATDG